MKSRGRVDKYSKNPKYLGNMLKKAFALHCANKKIMSHINFIKICGAFDLPI